MAVLTFDGYYAESFIDGRQLAPDHLENLILIVGIWKPIDVSGLTFGTMDFI